MRTNVNLDKDVHQIASVYASANGITLGAAIGELIRRASGRERRTTAASPRLITASNGLRIVPKGAGTLTAEMVQAALNDEE
jgi:hypothetical protein